MSICFRENSMVFWKKFAFLKSGSHGLFDSLRFAAIFQSATRTIRSRKKGGGRNAAKSKRGRATACKREENRFPRGCTSLARRVFARRSTPYRQPFPRTRRSVARRFRVSEGLSPGSTRRTRATAHRCSASSRGGSRKDRKSGLTSPETLEFETYQSDSTGSAQCTPKPMDVKDTQKPKHRRIGVRRPVESLLEECGLTAHKVLLQPLRIRFLPAS